MYLANALAPSQRVLILASDSFDEEATVICIHALRNAGLAVSLVGLTAGLVTGSRGITLQPDLSLDELPPGDGTGLVIFPGGTRCATALLADPQVHRLADRAVAGGGQVAVLATAVPVAERLLQVPFVQQSDLSIHHFIAQLLRALGA